MDKDLWDLYLHIIHSGGIGDVEAWTKLDLTMPQLKVIMLLIHHGEMTVGQLAENLSVSLPNMTGIIDRLQLQGFVDRVHSEKDRRVVYISNTEKTRDLFAELNQSGFEKFKRIEQYLSDNEKEIAKLGLKILVQAMKKVNL